MSHQGITMTIPAATALYLELETKQPTAKQNLQELLKYIKVLMKNPKLTISQIKKGLALWLMEGWIIVGETTIQVMRSGRAKIKQLADEATKPQQHFA